MFVGATVVLVRTAGVYNLFLPKLLTPQMRSFVSLVWCEFAGVRWARPHWVPEGGRAAQSSHNAVIEMAPLFVHNPGVLENWILLGDDFNTVFPFSAQCLARQWLYVHMFKSCGVARCSDWKICAEVGEGEEYKWVWITNVHDDSLWETLPGTVATCSCASLRRFGRTSQPSLVWPSRT